MNNAELIKKLKIFLARVLASETVKKKVLPQLDAFNMVDFKNSVTLEGSGDQHEVSISFLSGSVYKTHILYRWLPAEH